MSKSDRGDTTATNRGRPRVLSRRKILEAARHVPPEELSFKKLAGQLDVSTQAFYRYFTNIEELKYQLSQQFLRDIADERDSRPVHPTSSTSNFSDFILSFLLDFRKATKPNQAHPSLHENHWGSIGPDQDPLSTWMISRLEAYFRVAQKFGVDLNDAAQIWWITADFLASSRAHTVSSADFEKFHIGLRQSMTPTEDSEFTAVAAYLRQSENHELSPDAFFTRYARTLVRGLAHEFGLPQPTRHDGGATSSNAG